MIWYSLLYCPGRRSNVSMYADRPMHGDATDENDQREYHDGLEFDHEPSRAELEAEREKSKCPGCGLPYASVHDGQLAVKE